MLGWGRVRGGGHVTNFAEILRKELADMKWQTIYRHSRLEESTFSFDGEYLEMKYYLNSDGRNFVYLPRHCPMCGGRLMKLYQVRYCVDCDTEVEEGYTDGES